jgi:hypothetical protein
MSSASANWAPRPQEAQHHVGQQEAAERCDQDRIDNVAAEHDTERERDDRRDRREGQQFADPGGQPRLEDQPVERLDSHTVIAAAGQPALAAQLDQDVFAVGLILQ